MTLRSRLIAAGAAIGVLLIVSAIFIYQRQRAVLYQRLDAQLNVGLPRGPGDLRTSERFPQKQAEPNRTNGADVAGRAADLVLVIVTPDGQSSTVFPSAPASEPAIDLSVVRNASANDRPIDLAGADGAAGFRAIARATPSGDLLVAAISTASTERALNQLGATLAITVGLVLLGVGMVGWWVASLGLRPIRRMTEAAEAITTGQLDHRIDVPSGATEAGRLGLALNTMLDERTAGEARLRRFVSDASHELRTPLTSISGYLDLYQRGGLGDPEMLDDALGRVSSEATRMRSLVDDMLALARLDEHVGAERTPVDLTELLGQAISDARAGDPARTWLLGAPDDLRVVAVDDQIRQVVGSLLSNVTTHTPAATTARLRGSDDEIVWIEVLDDGPGMDPEVAAHVFERFYRGELGRTRVHGSNGLGMAIAAAIATAHGGSLSVSSDFGVGSTFRLELPADAQL